MRVKMSESGCHVTGSVLANPIGGQAFTNRLSDEQTHQGPIKYGGLPENGGTD